MCERQRIGERLYASRSDGPVRFWLDYGELCPRLLGRSDLDVLRFDVGEGWAGIEEVVTERAGLPPA